MKELDKNLEKKLGGLEIIKELQKIIKDELLVSYDSSSLCASAHIDVNKTWPQKKQLIRLKKI